jgi:hypothetical protein
MKVPSVSDDIEIALKSLKRNHFDARFASTLTEARTMMLNMIPLTASVGIGDSVTLKQTGVIDELVRRGNQVINPFTAELTRDPAKRSIFVQRCRETFGTDVFITGGNAVTEDGKIVSIDYAGNRVAGTIYGAEHVIVTVGRNKIVKDVDGAINRIKQVIAPVHARCKGHKTPCAVTGECTDCDSPSRICNVTIVLEKKPGHTDLSVIIVDEDLGLGWDPAWDEKRISQIESNYNQHTWAFFANK